MSNPTPNNNPNASVTIISSEVLSWQAIILDAAANADLTMALQGRLGTALKNALDGANGLANAQGQIALISADPRYSRQYKADQAKTVAKAAGDAALKAVDALGSVRDDVVKQLDKALTIGKKASVTDAVWLDKKADILRILDHQPDGYDTAQQAAQLLDAALDNEGSDDDADLAAYVITNKLDLYLQSRNANMQTWATLRGQVIGKHKGDGSPIPGSQLYGVLCGAGQASLGGYITYLRFTVQRVVDSMNDSIARGSVYWQDGGPTPTRSNNPNQR